jgi:hypothetical protein
LISYFSLYFQTFLWFDFMNKIVTASHQMIGERTAAIDLKFLSKVAYNLFMAHYVPESLTPEVMEQMIHLGAGGLADLKGLSTTVLTQLTNTIKNLMKQIQEKQGKLTQQPVKTASTMNRIITASQQIDQVSDGLTQMVKARVLSSREVQPLLIRLDRVANQLDQVSRKRVAFPKSAPTLPEVDPEAPWETEEEEFPLEEDPFGSPLEEDPFEPPYPEDRPLPSEKMRREGL